MKAVLIEGLPLKASNNNIKAFLKRRLGKGAKFDENKVILDRDDRGKSTGIAWIFLYDNKTIIDLLYLHE
jgi:hypothetical protein